MNCENCGKKIPKERLKALPNTKTCVKCSDVKPFVGIIDEDDVIIVPEEDAERLNELKNLHR